MRKLRLDLQSLQVESFAAETPPPARTGTVRGQDSIEYQDVDDGWGYGGGVNTVGTCIGPTYCCPATWKPTCRDTCFNTCNFTCDGPTGVCQIP
jgi:hypothetical protein